jgi:hypothetical protein
MTPSLKFYNLRSSWRYELNARPEECVDAFLEAFSGRGGLLAKGNWSVSRNGAGALATYQGRAGIGAIAGAGSGRQAAEMESAIGSVVKFEVKVAAEHRASCTMRIEARGSTMGFTSDARFIRPYLRAVEKNLRRIDPSLEAG